MPDGPAIQELVLEAVDQLGGRAHRRAITRRVLEIGNFSPEQLAVPPPSTNTGGFPNRIEYLVSHSLSALKKKGRLDNVERGEWQRMR